MDMFAVSLVIPLLFQYYKAAGVKKANQREMMSSLFSTAQIVGGLIMGVLTDAGYVPGRMLLFLSFAGSAISYALIGHNNASLVALMISRILVGLVKQTMTVSITMVTNATSADTRAEHLGKLTAASTIAWIIGPTIGSWLFRYVDERAPAWVATGLFLINLLIAFFFLGEEEEEKNVKNWNRYREEKSKQQTSKDELKRQDKSIVHNLKACFGSRALGSVVVVRLIITWVTQSMNYNQLSNFWESMHDGLESHHRGYISSYQQALQFVVQSVMVDWIFQRSGDFRRTTVLFSFLVSLAVLLESQRSLLLFLIVLCPIKSIAFTMMNLSLQTLLTDVAPKEAIFSVLAALDVLQNMASVSVPFYRSLLFRILASDEANDAMQGDPDPQAWIWSSAVHWFIASILASILLLSNSATTGTNITRAYTAKTA
jgi:MFS family permease